MTLAAFNGQALDTNGNVVTVFQVEVKKETDGSLALVYSDRDGASALANPFTPSSGDNGYFRFHAAGGAYRIRIFTAGGDVSLWRYVAIGLGSETDTVIRFPGYLMIWDTLTADGVSFNGGVRANNASLASATQLYVSKLNSNGDSIETRLNELVSGDKIILTQDTGSQASFNITGVTEGAGSPALYKRINVNNHSGDTSFINASPISLQLQVRGPAGEVTSSGSALVGQVAVFANTSADVIQGAITDDSPPVAITIATDANIRAAADGKLIHAGQLESAAAGVALTDAATVAIDWDTGINFTLTVTANRILGNPTNGQPGTWRTVLVQGDVTSPASNRTLTFGNQYLGDIPTITDINDTNWYLLMIYCVSSTHFVVSSKEAK